MAGEEENYILASRDAAQTMDRLLSADLEHLRTGGDDWADTAEEADARARDVAGA